MKTAIKIVKRNNHEDPPVEQNREKPGQQNTRDQNTRDIVVTVKSWILEAQQRKRAEQLCRNALFSRVS